jgi:hypothetical protein
MPLQTFRIKCWPCTLGGVIGAELGGCCVAVGGVNGGVANDHWKVYTYLVPFCTPVPPCSPFFSNQLCPRNEKLYWEKQNIYSHQTAKKANRQKIPTTKLTPAGAGGFICLNQTTGHHWIIYIPSFGTWYVLISSTILPFQIFYCSHSSLWYCFSHTTIFFHFDFGHLWMNCTDGVVLQIMDNLKYASGTSWSPLQYCRFRFFTAPIPHYDISLVQTKTGVRDLAGNIDEIEATLCGNSISKHFRNY